MHDAGDFDGDVGALRGARGADGFDAGFPGTGLRGHDLNIRRGRLHETGAGEQERAEEIERDEASAQNADGNRNNDDAPVHRNFGPLPQD